jgi:stage V sporulation protein S
VGSAAIRFIREGNDVELLAMGAGAVNQAIKSVIKARGFAAPSGIDLLVRPGFTDVEVNGVIKSAVCLHIVRS